MKTNPWKHQQEALDYLIPRDCAGLYTRMGSGKTKIMIDLINTRNFQRVLVVCPKKVCDLKVWEKQFQLHSTNREIEVVNLAQYSSTQKCGIVGKNWPTDKSQGQIVLVCNYDSVWREPFRSWLLNKAKLDCVICDESHRIKSPSSKVSSFLTLLGKRVKHRYLMTGTPLAQSPLDIYAQYRFLDPTIFGTRFDDFKWEYANMIRMDGYDILDKKNPYKNLDRLRQKMFSCAFFVDAKLDLPETQDIVVTYQLPKETRKHYEFVKTENCLEIENAGSMVISCALTMIMRLQQIANGFIPVINEDKEKILVDLDDERAETLKSILDGVDEPVVVFARFKKDLKAIRKVTKELGKTYSELSGSRNTTDDWLEGKTDILGVQIQAGAEGIDLTRARYCVYYSLTHSLAQWEQSRARIHRPGQTKPVIYYTILAEKTLDEDIYQGLLQKRDIVHDIIEKAQNGTLL